jgi:phosphopantothenoylcysteine decarboxylase/phosphopantothenate--cysteine ligase
MDPRLSRRLPRPPLRGLKAASKEVDLLVANDVTAPGSGFGTDTNAVTVFGRDGSSEAWPMMSKQAVAARLWDRIVALRSL